MSRYECNKQILKMLEEYVENNKDFRFGQILYNYTSFKGDHDPFYDESEKTLKYMETVKEDSFL